MMFLIIFLCGARAEDDADRELNEKLRDFAKNNVKVGFRQREVAKYRIDEIMKKHIPVSGNVDVALRVSPVPEKNGFCKFDLDVVEATILDGLVYCKAPPHKEGTVILSFSDDREDWSEAVPVMYYSNESTVIIILGVIIGVSIISFVLFILQMRKCQNESKMNREKVPIAFQESKSSMSIEENSVSKPVQRNISHLL